MKLSNKEIGYIARTNIGNSDVAKLVCHIAELETELDMARMAIGATLKARSQLELSVARRHGKEILARNNLLEFYKSKSAQLPQVLEVLPTPI